ncbi:MAG TPA: hypothetical protein VIM12_00455 [Noviherbaspirillum sp.]|jgi:uncharacterized protein YceK|uniref:hypothetical protein n=1 Tax=Noviherbaspirillum sp. TaxID=1926288 RepID=UPI002F92CF7A
MNKVLITLLAVSLAGCSGMGGMRGAQSTSGGSGYSGTTNTGGDGNWSGTNYPVIDPRTGQLTPYHGG